ncbi:hypothetical protein [Bacteroides ndongoniae]|uniref:hypothetical protein n=1 Tax=Bacteroides ndongoniae TaxID=1903262 RepID=UPI001356566A|nr:hypothetical protein [Bacteroides ndongoniae]
MKKEETYEQKKRRLFGRFHRLDDYLGELNHLIKHRVTKQEIMSIIDSDLFLESNRKYSWNSKLFQTIDFSNKALLLDILRQNISRWDMPYILYTVDSKDCGCVCLSSLDDFNWMYNMHDTHGGLIDFIRIDHRESICLDWDWDTQELDIEIQTSVISVSPNDRSILKSVESDLFREMRKVYWRKEYGQ